LTPQSENSSQSPPNARPQEPPSGGDEGRDAPRVTLVGAGPGDPGLITAAGLEALRHADAVVYDALANPRLLEAAPDHAQLIDAGKRAKAHRLTQDQTNDLLVQLARAGKRVVRLKGGDPYLFGRGAEEVAYLAKHGVRCQVIPGVTAGIAAPMYAGIPVTHRRVASTVTFVTAHEDPGKDQSAVDYQALAKLIAVGGTVCFYMGVGRLPRLAQTLVGFGLPPATPAAAVQWGTLPTQRSVRGDLSTLPGKVEQAGLGAPAIIVVGPAAGLEEPGLRFFEQRPLFGQTVLVTRTRTQASALSRLLEQAGARVVEAPTIRIEPPPSSAALDGLIADAGARDWLILTSANAVQAVAARLEALDRDARALAGARLAVVGQATANALFEHLRLAPDFVPARSHGEALARELAAQVPLSGQRIALIRGDLANDEMPRLLRDTGAEVEEVVAYHTTRVDQLPAEALEALREGGVNWAAFTSSSCVNNLVTLLGAERPRLDAVQAASIGPKTSASLRAAGLRVAAEAATPSVSALCDAIIEAQRGAEHHA
jgi:uroporphyrinogen III methyltransferase/synthase